MMRRFALVLAALLIVQGVAFGLYYRDLLYLRSPVASIAGGSRATFVRHATRALDRSRVTIGHLDTIAEAAKAFDESAIEIRALERRLAVDTSDRNTKLRLADALRRGGDFARAEAIYRSVLGAPAQEHQP
jgi:hypothetical protein